MANLEGKTLNGIYFLRKMIGSGGMAEVYDAFSKMHQDRFAVKVLRAEYANNPRFLQSFEDEANHLKTLSHPKIVRFYEFSRDQNIVYLVMDYIEGTNMRARIPKGKGMEVEEVARMLESVSPALNYAHQKYVYHCDIKPANILINKKGDIFLTDFGVARSTTTNMGGGTPAYMAPEMFNGGVVNVFTDIYMLGVTLYECFSGGHLPFRGDNPYSQGSTLKQRFAWEHRTLPVPPLRTMNPRVPYGIEQVIYKAMSKNPNERFRSVMELKQAFDRAKYNGSSTTEQSPTEFISRGSAQIPNSSNGSAVQVGKQNIGVNNNNSNQQINDGKITPDQHTRFESKPDSIEKIINEAFENRPPQEPKPSFSGPYLLCHKGEWQGQMIPISKKGMTIGRGNHCQLYIREPSASRNHAMINRSLFGGVSIVDENSASGTYVNRQKIEAGKAVRLQHGDLIQIAQYQLFEFREK